MHPGSTPAPTSNWQRVAMLPWEACLGLAKPRVKSVGAWAPMLLAPTQRSKCSAGGVSQHKQTAIRGVCNALHTLPGTFPAPYFASLNSSSMLL